MNIEEFNYKSDLVKKYEKLQNDIEFIEKDLKLLYDCGTLEIDTQSHNPYESSYGNKILVSSMCGYSFDMQERMKKVLTVMLEQEVKRLKKEQEKI